MNDREAQERRAPRDAHQRAQSRVEMPRVDDRPSASPDNVAERRSGNLRYDPAVGYRATHPFRPDWEPGSSRKSQKVRMRGKA